MTAFAGHPACEVQIHQLNLGQQAGPPERSEQILLLHAQLT